MSPDTAEFLMRLLDSVSLSVGADDFEATALAAIKAKAELRAVLTPPADG